MSFKPDAAARAAPTLRIIRQSGNFRPLEEDDATYLQKPYISLDLLRKVKAALTH